MRGEVISVDGLSGDGLISGDDGARYGFSASATRGMIAAGDRVDFVAHDGVATEIMIMSRGGFTAHAGPGSGSGRPYDAAYNFGWAMFAFDGRLRRSHYWISWLILFGIGFLANFIPFFGLFIGLALIWCHLAIGAKRFHDMGFSGWLIAIPWVTTVLGWIALIGAIGFSAVTNPYLLESDDPAALFGVLGPGLAILLLTWLVGVGFWLWLGIADGRRGPNKYGRNPKYPHEDTAATFG